MALAVRLPPPPLLGRLLGKWVSPEALTTPTLTFLALSALYIELRECPNSLRLTQPLTSLFGRRRDATYGLGKHEWGEPIISALLASSCTLLMATGEGGKGPLARGIRRSSPSFFVAGGRISRAFSGVLTPHTCLDLPYRCTVGSLAQISQPPWLATLSPHSHQRRTRS